ncbi:Uncharacterised protein [Escherichia coli]|uniref:DUF1281 domain-containing protein n=1 Tax=Escherichia coli TaxID=562 RepID=A0A376KQQ2_ECOLX|nr:Uncharacterised protein [Escherichia coli]
MRCQYSDWFGLVGLSEHIDAEACWSRLSDYPEQAQPCDMLMVIPSRLATELNGSGGLLQGISTTTSPLQPDIRCGVAIRSQCPLGA